MWSATDWKDYELIDASDGERLERWGKYILIRPDPQVVWKGMKHHEAWQSADAICNRSYKDGSHWKHINLPKEWQISYGELKFMIHPTGLKHTGLFPEQAVNWDWFSKIIRLSSRKIKVLNLFAYTGGATIAAAKAGSDVCHVDSAKRVVLQAKTNAELNGLKDAPIRYIVDDCKKFIEREIRRGNKYDAVIMDPPSYGRGPSGEVWKIEDNIHELIKLAVDVLSDNPLFFLVNSYTTGLSPSTTLYMLKNELIPVYGGNVSADEIGLHVTQTNSILPCGASARWNIGE